MVPVSQEMSAVHPCSIVHKGSPLSSHLTECWADQDLEIKTLSRPSQPCSLPWDLLRPVQWLGLESSLLPKIPLFQIPWLFGAEGGMTSESDFTHVRDDNSRTL